MTNTNGNSGAKWAVTTAGTFTIAAASRNNVDLVADWAASASYGMRFIAEVGGVWFGSAERTSPHGACTSSSVSQWVLDDSVSIEQGTWYEATGLPQGYDWRDRTRFSTTLLTGLPPGDITRFGMAWRTTSNHEYIALDNFRVTHTAYTSATLRWSTAQHSVDTSSNTNFRLGVRYHILTTVSGNTMRVYTNGVLQGETTVAAEPPKMARAQCYIGKSPISVSGYLNAEIAYLKLYSGTMHASDVTKVSDQAGFASFWPVAFAPTSALAGQLTPLVIAFDTSNANVAPPARVLYVKMVETAVGCRNGLVAGEFIAESATEATISGGVLHSTVPVTIAALVPPSMNCVSARFLHIRAGANHNACVSPALVVCARALTRNRSLSLCASHLFRSSCSHRLQSL